MSLKMENNRTEQENNKTTFLMRRVKMNEGHNKKGSPEVNKVRSSTWSMI